MDDTFVYYAKLPNGVDEMVVPCNDGYTIYIDKDLSSEQMNKAYCHAIKHIENNDFSKDDVQSIEKKAHDEEV